MHSLSFSFILKKYAPVRNTNDGRRFTNEHSLDAFHLARKIALMQTPEALVNEISTNLKSALNLLRVEEKATVVGDSYRWLLLNSHLALEPWEGKSGGGIQVTCGLSQGSVTACSANVWL